MKDIEISLEYEKLYFEDLILLLNSLRNSTRKFFRTEKYWLDDKIITSILNTDLKISKDEYYKILPNLRHILSKSITYEITEFKEGSIKLRCSIAVTTAVLITLASQEPFSFQLTANVLSALANILYNSFERDFDKVIDQVQSKLSFTSFNDDKRARGIKYSINRKNSI